MIWGPKPCSPCSLDPMKKIQFTMKVADDSGLEFLDLLLKYDKVKCKISVDVYAKPTNSFTYVLPTTCYSKNSINKIPEGIALRLRRICDSDEKFEMRSKEYQKYLVTRDYSPSLVSEQFNKVKDLTRSEARQPKSKDKRRRGKQVGDDKDTFSLVTVYNPRLKDLNRTIQQFLPLLYSDPRMKNIFPEGSIKAYYKRGKNLKEILSPSLYPKKHISREICEVKPCGRRCNICDEFLVFGSKFTCSATGMNYSSKGVFHVTVRMSYTSLLVKHVLNSMLVLLSVLRIVLGCIKVTSIREK